MGGGEYKKARGGVWRGDLTNGAICFQEEWSGREQLSIVTPWLTNGHRATALETVRRKRNEYRTRTERNAVSDARAPPTHKTNRMHRTGY